MKKALNGKIDAILGGLTARSAAPAEAATGLGTRELSADDLLRAAGGCGACATSSHGGTDDCRVPN
jgi:hypothetical protein